MTNNSTIIKKRYWAIVLYPDSAPIDWQQKLTETGLPIAISPLHDKDINPDNTPKKAHYHVILCYGGPTTFNAVNSLASSLNQPIPIPLEQVKGYYKYLTHKDNPEKFQYDEKDIILLNGFSILDYSTLTEFEGLELKRKVLDLIREIGFCEYFDLVEYLTLNNQLELLNCVSNNTYFFNSFLRSKRNKFIEK